MIEIKFYCNCCETHQYVIIGILRSDDLNKGFPPWSDIFCNECSFVIATISANSEGKVVMTVEELPK